MVSGGKDDSSIAAVTGLDWDTRGEFVDRGEFGDAVMGLWVVNGFDIVGSKVDLELTSVVEETPSVTVEGFKDVRDELTKDSVDVDMEAGVLGFKDV